MKILHIILYKADFFSNFMESILYLSKEIKKINGEIIICIPKKKWWTNFFSKENIKIELLPIKYTIDLRAIKLLKNIIKKYNPHIIHTHFGREAQVISCICKILFNSKIKIVWHWRNPPKTDIILNYPSSYIEYLCAKYKRWIGNFFYKILDNFVSAHIVVSDEIKEILIKKGLPEKKIKKIFNAISTQGVSINSMKLLRYPQQMGGSPRNGTLNNESVTMKETIANISNFREQKDHKTFIKAAKIVIEKYPDTKFILVGDGPTKSSTIEYAKKLGILNNLIFTGIKQEVKEIINKSSFVVLSSFYEGFPNIILEAMVLKKPVIATNVGGVPEIIKDGYNGFLIPIKNHIRMAEKIIYFIENPEEIKRLGENGKKTIEEKFSINKWKKEIISVYKEILKN